MFKRGDIVVRNTPDHDNTFVLGQREEVAYVVDEHYMLLKGKGDVHWLQSSFDLLTPEEANRKPQGNLSELDEITDALSKLKKWNDTKPTNFTIKMLHYPVQDGGTMYEVNGEIFDRAVDFKDYMSRFLDTKEKLHLMRQMMTVIDGERSKPNEFGLNEDD